MKVRAIVSLIFLCLLAGCGSSNGATAGATPTDAGGAAGGSTTSGDIPDTASYVTYQGSGYSLKYVEGWIIQKGPSSGVTIADKDSRETVVLPATSGSTPSSVAAADLSHLRAGAPRFQLLARRSVPLPGGSARYIQYRTLSPPDPVTSKRVPVIVDRYYIAGPGKLAILTLATPVGVDNVDAFRLIARSFHWK